MTSELNFQELLSQYKRIQEYALQQCEPEKKEELQKLFDFVDTQTNFLTSPASTKYHMSVKHGLLCHSMNVARTLMRLKKILAPEISDISCIVVGLYHDLGKHNQYIMKEPTYAYPTGIFYKNDIIHMPHAHRSLYLISQVYKLTEEEAQAILAHDGQYVEDNSYYAHKEFKLTMLLHMADIWSAKYLE